MIYLSEIGDNKLCIGYPVSERTSTPIISSNGIGGNLPTQEVEQNTVQIYIDNYNAGATYSVSVTGGTATKIDNIISWVLPGVLTDSNHTIEITAKIDEKTTSYSIAHNIIVLDVLPSDAPILSRDGAGYPLPTEGYEHDVINIIIDNYSSSNVYEVNTTHGAYTIVNDSITWELPAVAGSTTHSLEITSKTTGKATSPITTYNINVLDEISTTPSVSGDNNLPLPIEQNEQTELILEIQNYNANNTYNITISSGSYYVSTNNIIWTLPDVGDDEIHNIVVKTTEIGKSESAEFNYSLNVLLVGIKAPTITTPLDAAVDQREVLDISTTSYSISQIPSSEVHISTHWQLSTTSDFSTLVQDVTNADLENWSTEELTVSTTYYVRAKHISANYSSDWSSSVSFTTKASFDYELLQKISSPDGQIGDKFGYDIDVKRDICIIGAPDYDESASNSGKAYIFEKEGTNWVHKHTLSPSLGNTNAKFGSYVKIAMNGLRCAISAPGTGIYIFEFDGVNWNETTIVAEAGCTLNGTGLATDSNIFKIAFGAHDGSVPGDFVYEYTYSTGTWNYISRFNAQLTYESGSCTGSIPFKNKIQYTPDGLTLAFKGRSVGASDNRRIILEGVDTNEYKSAEDFDGDGLFTNDAVDFHFSNYNNQEIFYVSNRGDLADGSNCSGARIWDKNYVEVFTTTNFAPTITGYEDLIAFGDYNNSQVIIGSQTITNNLDFGYSLSFQNKNNIFIGSLQEDSQVGAVYIYSK